MTEIVLFKSQKIEKTSILEWVSEHRDEEEMRELFINMDIALKYIHEHGYCVEVFYPTKIEVLNNQLDHIQFDNLMELSNDPITRKEMIREDIFNSTLIQIGMYTNTLRSLTPEFLREQFDNVAKFIPEGDVPYYRGVVQRGATVYFSEFAVERMKRDLVNLEKQLGEGDGKATLTKTNGHNIYDSLSNDKINDSIYRQINGMRDAAFINSLVIPTLALVSLLLIALIGWIITLI